VEQLKILNQPIQHLPEVEDMSIDSEKLTLFQLSDASGKITFTKKAEGKINGSMFDSNDVFILDGKIQLFVWIGKGASHGEKSQAMKYAEKYIVDQNRPKTLPVSRIHEGQFNQVFATLIKW